MSTRVHIHDGRPLARSRSRRKGHDPAMPFDHERLDVYKHGEGKRILERVASMLIKLAKNLEGA